MDADTVGTYMNVLAMGSGGATYQWHIRHWGGSTEAADRLEFSTHAFTPILVLKGNGNVGIGTTSPTLPLDVYKSTGAAVSVESGVNSAGEIQYTGLRIGSSASASTGDYIGITFPGYGGGGSRSRAGIGAKFTNGPGASDLVFMTRYALDGTELSTSDIKMVVTSGGNVGIGTTNPTSTLYVAGTFTATGTKSAIVNTSSFGQRKLYALESPEVRFTEQWRSNNLP